MMNNIGLGATGASEQGKQGEIDVAVNDIILMLENGIGVEELLAKGIPEELIRLALDKLDANSVEQEKDTLMKAPGSVMEQNGLASNMMRQ